MAALTLVGRHHACFGRAYSMLSLFGFTRKLLATIMHTIATLCDVQMHLSDPRAHCQLGDRSGGASPTLHVAKVED